MINVIVPPNCDFENQTIKSESIKGKSERSKSDLDIPQPVSYRASNGLKKYDYDLNSVSCYFNGKPLTNGFVESMANPVFDADFSYLNRNKIINRRMIIRQNFARAKQTLGQQTSVTPTHDMEKSCCSCDFTLTKPSYCLVSMDSIADSNRQVLTETYPGLSSAAKLAKSKSFIRSSPSVVVVERMGLRRNKTSMDRNGPSPFTYHVPRQPPGQKSSPKFTIGTRCFNEKEGGGRTSWQKEWFNSSNPFLIKTDFGRESRWPSPDRYRLKSTLLEKGKSPGAMHRPTSMKVTNSLASVKLTPPSQPVSKNKSIKLLNDLLGRNGANGNDSNADDSSEEIEADVMKSVNHVKASQPKIRLKFRQHGTILWPKVEKTPGPGAYNAEKFKYVQKSNPKFSLPHARLQLNNNHTIGPFAAF